jgi:uncharacterized protein with GYD domain
MIMITRGCLTANYLKSFVAAPEDREAAMRKLVEASGGRMLAFYFIAGDRDFLMITETDVPEKVTAISLAVSSTGAVSDITTTRAWTGAEFKKIGDMAGDILSAYRFPAPQ